MSIINEAQKIGRWLPLRLRRIVRVIEKPVTCPKSAQHENYSYTRSSLTCYPDPFVPVKRRWNDSRTEIIEERYFMLFHLVQISALDAKNILSPSIDLNRGGAPEDLVEHDI